MNDSTIKKISIYKLSIPLKEPFVTSLGPEYTADNIVVIINTCNGLKGTGECSPYMAINGESQATCFEVGQYLARALKGRDATDISGNHQAMDRVIFGNTSIKSAFDIAMYDIAAQEKELPLYKFLGAKKVKKMVTDYTVSLGKTEAMVAHAASLKKDGFKIIKVKLGDSPEKDIETMKAIRSAVGKAIALRIDANQGWLFDDAVKALKGMHDLDIQYCEEPIPRWDWMRLKDLKKKSPIPIMADESCFDEHDAEKLIALKSCQMFNLKLGKSSGIFRARKIIALAEKAAMDMQVGGFMESRIGMTANAHLALSSAHIKYFDFDTPLMFISDPVTGGISYSHGGAISMPTGPGLGLSVQEKILKKLEQMSV